MTAVDHGFWVGETRNHLERDAGWLMREAREGRGLNSDRLWNAVMETVERLPEGDLLRWQRGHLEELRTLAYGSHRWYPENRR